MNPTQDPTAPEPFGLHLSLGAFDGPIDLLLSLAKEQKVDLATLAILPLAEQYLAYIASARKLRLEVAADYLVMAAWLAFLKSRLLLPAQEQAKDEQDPVAMAEALKFQLLRLEAMQNAAQRLMERPQLDTDVFLRGQPETFDIVEKPIYYLPIQDLLTAISAPLRRQKPAIYNIAATRLYSLDESVRRLRGLLGDIPDWDVLQSFLPEMNAPEELLERRSAIASTFAATLELVKHGEIELQQNGTFAPIYMRRKERSWDELDADDDTFSTALSA